MGDHSKCGINTMLNTGTVIGVSCNVYGAGFPRNFIPSFSWGSANGFMEYQLSKAIDTAVKVFARRNLEFNEMEQIIGSVKVDLKVMGELKGGKQAASSGFICTLTSECLATLQTSAHDCGAGGCW